MLKKFKINNIQTYKHFNFNPFLFVFLRTTSILAKAKITNDRAYTF